MENKPGYATTEFWFSILSVAAILLKIAGIDLNENDTQALAAAFAAVAGGFLVVFGIVNRYIKSRAEVKKAVVYQSIARESAVAGRPVTLSLGDK